MKKGEKETGEKISQSLCILNTKPNLTPCKRNKDNRERERETQVTG